MTPNECNELMATLTAAGLKWTAQRWNDASPAIWERYLRPLDNPTAFEALGLWLASNDEFPTIAEYKSCYEQSARRRAMATPALPESTEKPPTPARRRTLAEQWVPLIKEKMREARPWYIDAATGERREIPADIRPNAVARPIPLIREPEPEPAPADPPGQL